MIEKLVAYDLAEVRKKKVLSEAKNLYNSKLLSEEQWNNIKTEYSSKLYTPAFYMKILFFIFSLLGMLTIMGPISLLMGNAIERIYRIVCLIIGIILLTITEKYIIRKKLHFKSGITEAGIYAGSLFIYFGILDFNQTGSIYFGVAFLLALIIAVRYVDIIATALALIFFSIFLFEVITLNERKITLIVPFLFISVFSVLYWYSKKLQGKISEIIFEDQFILVKTLSLLIIYISGNYFVIDKLGSNIIWPSMKGSYLFVFYFTTVFIPVLYLYFGVKQKSILFIRVGLLTFALTAITLKYYFSFNHPMVTITVAGAILIAVALLLFRYLKKLRNGFTKELLLNDKWSSKDISAIIASQTLGGVKINEQTVEDDFVFKGGSFGGGGASGKF